jgi:hypothetical protein
MSRRKATVIAARRRKAEAGIAATRIELVIRVTHDRSRIDTGLSERRRRRGHDQDRCENELAHGSFSIRVFRSSPRRAQTFNEPAAILIKPLTQQCHTIQAAKRRLRTR